MKIPDRLYLLIFTIGLIVLEGLFINEHMKLPHETYIKCDTQVFNEHTGKRECIYHEHQTNGQFWFPMGMTALILFIAVFATVMVFADHHGYLP
jgi:hypothetical protein